jgi:hypothetical protein
MDKSANDGKFRFYKEKIVHVCIDFSDLSTSRGLSRRDFVGGRLIRRRFPGGGSGFC